MDAGAKPLPRPLVVAPKQAVAAPCRSSRPAETGRWEESRAARDAMAQIPVSSCKVAAGRRPICQDTGTAQVLGLQ